MDSHTNTTRASRRDTIDAGRLARRCFSTAAWLGAEFDAATNQRGGPLRAAQSRVYACAIPTHDELMIAHDTRRILERG